MLIQVLKFDAEGAVTEDTTMEGSGPHGALESLGYGSIRINTREKPILSAGGVAGIIAALKAERPAVVFGSGGQAVAMARVAGMES